MQLQIKKIDLLKGLTKKEIMNVMGYLYKRKLKENKRLRELKRLKISND
jgi:hypothetical protein